MKIFFALAISILSTLTAALKHIECTYLPSDIKLAADINAWSGYIAATDNSHPADHSVTFVSGSWTVPLLHSGFNSPQHCVMWVGIDSIDSVEQIGIFCDWINGAQQNLAFFEMAPQPPLIIENFPLNPGDFIYASVTYVGHDKFQMTIKNITQGVVNNVPTSLTTSSTAKRSTAEWIVEAPLFPMDFHFPLSNFGNFFFSNCKATINGVTAPILNNFWQNQISSMNVVLQYGITATPSSIFGSGGNFTVTWMEGQ